MSEEYFKLVRKRYLQYEQSFMHQLWSYNAMTYVLSYGQDCQMNRKWIYTKLIDAVDSSLRDISRLLMCSNTKPISAHLESTKALFYFKKHFLSL